LQQSEHEENTNFVQYKRAKTMSFAHIKGIHHLVVCSTATGDKRLAIGLDRHMQQANQ
jgi:hypothetical protein